jgi:predicted secreted acid phosphatase
VASGRTADLCSENAIWSYLESGEVFENSTTVDSRMKAADCYRDQLGQRFIILPNAMYGNWESAIYDNNFKLSEEEKAAMRKNLLRAY